MTNVKIAAVIPCYNEEFTIAKVITDLKSVLPGAVVPGKARSMFA
jgi:glycosyltransferase involved in cell wall biosynthesis